MPVFELIDFPIFPPPEEADESGLLAVGGDLSSFRLIEAYRQGIFPWYEEGTAILWWSPDPRLILEPDDLKITRSLRRVMARATFQFSADIAFREVIRACATDRKDGGTWITAEMERAYLRLFRLGLAHSIESWSEGTLVGGLYGVCLGRCFFGESMFSRRTDASKAALVTLVAHLKTRGVELIDCQIRTEHLMRLGAKEIPRREFLERLSAALRHPTRRGRWRLSAGAGAGHSSPRTGVGVTSGGGDRTED